MRHIRLCSVLLGMAAVCSGKASAQTPHPSSAGEPVLAIRLRGAAAQSLRRAVLGARRRLAVPSCQRLLIDFHDDSGRSLDDVLSGLAVSPAEYLSLIIFFDGSSRRRCMSGEALAVTQAGSRVVWVCAEVFRATETRDARLAEAIVIHEMLHTLGLGEGRPATLDITRAILGHCQEKPNASVVTNQAPVRERATRTAER